jgi:hypothetical protein
MTEARWKKGQSVITHSRYLPRERDSRIVPLYWAESVAVVMTVENHHDIQLDLYRISGVQIAFSSLTLHGE